MPSDLNDLASGGLVRWGEADTDPLADIEEWKRLVSNERVIVIGDYAEIEKRIIAGYMASGGCFIDGSSFVTRQLAEMFEPVPEPEPAGEPMKQNGRSAAYLKHDHTKQHRRRR